MTVEVCQLCGSVGEYVSYYHVLRDYRSDPSGAGDCCTDRALQYPSSGPYEEVADVLSQEEYLCVAKLSAILRVANALDQSHKQKFKNIRIAVRRKLVITVEAFEDIALEQALFDAKTSYFENVYSMKPVLKEKRIYNY